MELAIPAGDTTWRHVCTSCSRIEYYNPKNVCGCIVEHEGKVLLCRRGIEPCRGLWGLPAGYQEVGESTAQGAARETREEACAEVEILAPYAHLDVPAIGQACILFRARLAAPYTFAAGLESLEAALFELGDIPWGELAFSSATITLQKYVADAAAGCWHVHHGVIAKVPGSAPNDPDAYELRDHFALPLAAGPQ